jgi:hypothetical protein
MTDDKLQADIRPPPPPDESAQCGSIYFEARDLAQDAVQDGYDRRAVAEGLLEAARGIVADNQEFMTIFERFWARWNIR